MLLMSNIVLRSTHNTLDLLTSSEIVRHASNFELIVRVPCM